MRPVLARVSSFPAGWAVCRAIGRRRPVIAWAIFAEDGGRETVGMIARGATLARGDRLPGFVGYARGSGCEPESEPPALPPADLNDAMRTALDVDTDEWATFEARIRENLAAAANTEFATAALAGFEAAPGFWFRAWLRGWREHGRTERDLLRRLRALSVLAPGRSLQAALVETGVSLGELVAGPPHTTRQRNIRELARKPGRQGEHRK